MICNRCLESKDDTLMERKSAARGRGLTGRCKACAVKRAVAWQKNNRPKARSNVTRTRHKYRALALAAYGAWCRCCGDDTEAFLAIDHVYGGGGEHRRSLGIKGGHNFYLWLKQQEYPKGEYQVLCHNCNQAKVRPEGCPHQSFNLIDMLAMGTTVAD